jgi:hypothetical protein
MPSGTTPSTGHSGRTLWSPIAAPILGRLPVAEIDVPLVLKVLEQPIEA